MNILETSTIREISTDDAPALSGLLQRQRPSYLRHFHPFAFDEASIKSQLSQRVCDKWWAILVQEICVGFFMLRGFDAGYERPSFGVFVTEEQAGKGLGKMAIDYSQQWALRNGVSAIMLKVEPENKAACALYEQYGFRPIGQCAESGQEILEWKAVQ